ncbi:anti-sigma factor [Methylobacterium sp. NEAU K]|uniref:anti-sigma factor family protein n=1 Tax=Methylobacterium sp. NEAU K TaxID=3064946 RepID=UPI002735EB59|nr:anti-sigma factor [Methylobacterium sp. NEAU K]MDP4005503.1 anti-sigma factor [Methylobacterium sp. NEAU K]
MTGDRETFLLLGAYTDGELSPGEVLAMERRLAAEPALQAMAERVRGLSAAVQGVLADLPASPILRGRVVQRIGFADPASARGMGGPRQRLAATLLAGVVAGASVGGGAVYLHRSDAPAAMREAVLAGHLRGLVAPQPFDIASSDRHVVKPWFNGRTTIAPETPDLADLGFPLAGGRIDIVGGRAVPTLVYRRDRHVISVTIGPAASDGAAVDERRDGTTILRWSLGDLTYWAVSDLNARDLRGFVDLFRSRLAGPGDRSHVPLERGRTARGLGE